MPSKRIRSVFPSTSGGGGGSTTLDVPTARWSEDATAGDDLRVQTLLAEDAQVDDALKYQLIANPENANVDDALSVPLMAPAYAEDVQVNDLTKIQVLNLIVGRSGTPDSDIMFDAWTDQASTGTNHGNEALQAKGNATAGSNERRAYMALDLTGLAGCVGVNALSGGFQALTLDVQASNSNLLLATTLTCEFQYLATKPFTESTVTWGSPPSGGTSNGTSTASIAAGGGFATYTFVMAASLLTNACGKWLLCIFTAPGGVAPDTITIKSRDDATASNRPAFSYAVQRGT